MKYFLLILALALSFNIYSQEDKTIKIGTQIWMSENLNVTTFKNGDVIKEAKTLLEWEKYCKQKKPAWCYYKFNPLNGNKYGKLYNLFVIKDARGIAPNGWRVPSNLDFVKLENTIKIDSTNEVKQDIYNYYKTCGFQLKAKKGWDKFKGQDGNGSDKFGFNALPGGYIDTDFSGMGEEIYYWSTTTEDFNYHLSNGWFGSEINGNVSESSEFCCRDNFGFYIRCIKE